LFRSDFDDADGGLDVGTTGIVVEAYRPAWIGCVLTLRASYEHRRYAFHGANPLFPGSASPFENVHTFGAGLSIFQGVSEEYGIAALLTATVTASAEVGADLSDAVAGSLFAGIGRQFSESFTGGVGVALFTRIEDDFLWIPGIQLNWKVTERLTVSIDGATLQLSYAFAPSHALALVGGFDGRRFRLDDGAPGSGSVIEEQRAPVFLQYTHRPYDSLRIIVSAGHDVLRIMSRSDRQGNNTASYDMEPGAFVGLSVDFDF
jgi:hypothetical protein